MESLLLPKDPKNSSTSGWSWYLSCRPNHSNNGCKKKINVHSQVRSKIRCIFWKFSQSVAPVFFTPTVLRVSVASPRYGEAEAWHLAFRGNSTTNIEGNLIAYIMRTMLQNFRWWRWCITKSAFHCPKKNEMETSWTPRPVDGWDFHLSAPEKWIEDQRVFAPPEVRSVDGWMVIAHSNARLCIYCQTVYSIHAYIVCIGYILYARVCTVHVHTVHIHMYTYVV